MLRRIKKSLAPSISRLGARFGVPWPWMIDKLGYEALIEQMRILFREPFGNFERTDSPLDILMMPYTGCFLGNNIIQVTLGKALEERGHRVRFLACDIPLPICESTDIGSHERRDEICSENDKRLRRFLEATGMQTLLASEIVTPEHLHQVDLSEADRWKDFCHAMLLRYFKVGELDRQHPLFEELNDRCKMAAIISQRIGEAIVRLKPDRVISAHGTYTTRGPGRMVMNEAGIPHLTISRSKLAQAQKFNWQTPGDWWSIDETWERESERDLTSSQENLIDDYLQTRRSHSKDVMVYNFSEEESQRRTLEKLGIPSGQKIYTLFTNVLWDAASAQREIVFDGALDWVMSTIQAFKELPDRSLVVRIHPAESIIGTKQPMMTMIRKQIPDIPSNVKLLEPEAPFNSWSLLKVTDIGLVHTSTVGLELALEGIPCVCVSNTHYRNKDFTVDPRNRDEYEYILRNGISNFDSWKTKTLAKKYAYHLFLRYQIPLPFFMPESHVAIRSFKHTNWNEVSTSDSVKLFIEGVEDQTPEFMMSDDMAQLIHGAASK